MIKKEIIIGVFTGLIANAIGLLLAAFFLGNGNEIETTIKESVLEGIFGKLVTIGAILNLIVFFIFIKKKQDYRAKGVLLATIFVAISTFIFNLS
jgi:hypothetical protein